MLAYNNNTLCSKENSRIHNDRLNRQSDTRYQSSPRIPYWDPCEMDNYDEVPHPAEALKPKTRTNTREGSSRTFKYKSLHPLTVPVMATMHVSQSNTERHMQKSVSSEAKKAVEIERTQNRVIKNTLLEPGYTPQKVNSFAKCCHLNSPQFKVVKLDIRTHFEEQNNTLHNMSGNEDKNRYTVDSRVQDHRNKSTIFRDHSSEGSSPTDSFPTLHPAEKLKKQKGFKYKGDITTYLLDRTEDSPEDSRVFDDEVKPWTLNHNSTYFIKFCDVDTDNPMACLCESGRMRSSTSRARKEIKFSVKECFLFQNEKDVEHFKVFMTTHRETMFMKFCEDTNKKHRVIIRSSNESPRTLAFQYPAFNQ